MPSRAPSPSHGGSLGTIEEQPALRSISSSTDFTGLMKTNQQEEKKNLVVGHGRPECKEEKSK
jgi:hypothetical protein